MKDQPNSAIASLTLPSLRILPPEPPHTYVGIAHAMLEGVKALAEAENPPALALALLAAHTLECTLKAYLSRSGDDNRLKVRAVRHNLNALWSLAYAEGLSVPSNPPQWADTLSHLHNSPYYLRYSIGVHGIGSPAVEPMTTELQGILSQVLSQR